MATRPTIRNWMPPRDSIWRCPCGYTATYSKVCGHRRGHKNRPACASGEIQPVSEDAKPPHWDSAPQGAPSEGTLGPDLPPEDALEKQESPVELQPIYGETGDVQNAEEIAALLNRGVDDTPAASMGFQVGQEYDPYRHALDMLEASGAVVRSGPEGGDWSVDAPTELPGVFEVTLQVKVPPYLLAAYEWARSQGWHVGSDSFGEWLIDMALDHWSHCMDLEIGVFRKSEVADGDGPPAGNNHGGSPLAGAASNAQAQRN